MKLTTLTLALSMMALPVLAQQGNPGAHFIENWDMDGDGQITAAEAEEKRGEIFFMFDQDENGLLNDAEYTLFDETRAADIAANEPGLGRGPMKNAGQGMMREFNDADGDGQVSRDEFIGKTADWFKMMDRNGDGVVTTADFGPGRG